MTLQQLTYFIVLADMLHYTKAAQKLYISQPSLSRAISELEKELDAPLFEKDGKQTALTKYGQAFLPYAQQSIDRLEEGKRKVAQLLAPSPVIRLGYIYSLSFSLLPQVLEDFLAQPAHEGNQFTFFQGLATDILEKLKKGELDIALSLQSDYEGVESALFCEQELFLVVPRGHRFTRQNKILLEDLESESFVTIHSGSGLRRQLDTIFETLSATPHITFEAQECNAMASFVSAGLGIAIMPEIPALRSYNVEVLPVEDSLLKRKIYVLFAKDRPLPPAAMQFQSYLLDRCP